MNNRERQSSNASTDATQLPLMLSRSSASSSARNSMAPISARNLSSSGVGGGPTAGAQPTRSGVPLPNAVPGAAAFPAAPSAPAQPNATLNFTGPDPTTRPEAAAAYAIETYGLSLYPSRLPTACFGSSTVSNAALQGIQNFIFEGRGLNDCVDDYNAQGGRASSGMTISRSIKRCAPEWFAEEGVVMPWLARSMRDRTRLRNLGLSQMDFPVLQPLGVQAVAAPVVGQDAIPGDQTGEDEMAESFHSSSRERAQDNVADRPKPFARDEADNVGRSSASLARDEVDMPDEADDDGDIVVAFRKRRVDEFGEAADEQSESVSPKDCIRLQANVAQRGPLVVPASESNTDPDIERTTKLVLYPTLRNGLPAMDFQYDHNDLDEFVILRPEGITATPIAYTSERLWKQYFHAKRTNCPHVCDMVVDKFYQMFKKLERQGQDFGEILEFDIVGTLNDDAGGLHNEEDRPILTFFGDVLIATGLLEEIWQMPLSASRRVFFTTLASRGGDNRLSRAKQGAFCDRYHLHRRNGQDAKCYKEIAVEHAPEGHVGILYPPYFNAYDGTATQMISSSIAANFHFEELIPAAVQERIAQLERRKNGMLASIQDARKRDMEAHLQRVGEDYGQGLLALQSYEEELRKANGHNPWLSRPWLEIDGIIEALTEAVEQQSVQEFGSESGRFWDLYRAVKVYVARTWGVEV